MSDFQDIFKSCFEKLYGKPAWKVSPGWGSFLTMEFGEPHLEITQTKLPSTRRRVTVRGDWHLWIYCCDWHVFANGKAVGDASLNSKSKRKIIKSAQYLDGQKLVHASISDEASSLTLDFDLGGQLVTQPYDKKSEQWILFEPQGKCLTVRADGKFAYGNRPKEKWLKVK